MEFSELNYCDKLEFDPKNTAKAYKKTVTMYKVTISF